MHSKVNAYVVYQCKNLGDCFLTIPLLKEILDSDLSCKVMVICKSGNMHIFQGLSDRLSVFSNPRGLKALITLIRQIHGSRLFFLPHRSKKGLLLAKASRVAAVAHHSLKIPIFGQAEHRTPEALLPWRHTVEQNLDLWRCVGGVVNVKCLWNAHLIDQKKDPRYPMTDRYILIHPGSRWLFKSPPLKFWREIVEALETRGFRVVLTGVDTGQEGELLRSIVNWSGSIEWISDTSVSDLLVMLMGASGYLGVDTFVTHLAASSGVIGVALYGPTSELIWGPYGDLNRVVPYVHSDFPCRPCHVDGCGGSKVSDCLVDLDAKSVIARLFERMSIS